MTYKNTIKKYLKELPKQIEILEKEYSKIIDKKDFQDKMDDLKSYEKRMFDGLNYLNSIKDKKTINTINQIIKPTKKLLADNKKRYLIALKNYREKNNLIVNKKQINQLKKELKKNNLVHTTKNSDYVRKSGIKSALDLWLTPNKSCANAMDIVLGLDQYTFLTQGFLLDNFSDSSVEVNNKLLDKKDTIISSLDLFTFVLIHTKRIAPCAIQTEEWISSLKDYSKNLFAGRDFYQIKAEYILTFFKSIDEYNIFAKQNYYSNIVDKAPKDEYPFLGEIKALGSIKPKEIL